MKNDLRKLITFFEIMADGVSIINQDLTIEFMNPVMMETFGDCVGKKCYKALENHDEACIKCNAERVFKGETLRHGIYNRTVNRFYDIIEIPLKRDDGSVSKLSIFKDTSTRKKHEEEHKASEQQYRRLFEHISCGMFISSKEGKFLDCNNALLDMLGYPGSEEFLNSDIAHDHYVLPADRLLLMEIIERDGSVIDFDLELKKRDGSRIQVLLTGHVRHDEEGNVIGHEGIIVDQTRRKNREREIREANDLLNNIFHSSPNAIMAADMRGTIILWNRAAEEILGYRRKDVVGKLHITKVYPEGMAKKVMERLRTSTDSRKGQLKFYPVVFVKKDGNIVEGNLSASIVYDENQREIATVGILMDLQERLEIERRLKATQEQLLQSEKLAAMGRLTSQIAHELNNPLYGIMNTLELMKTEISPGNKRRKLLEMALSEIVRLSDLLRKMLTFSKPDQIEKQSVDINTIIDEILLLHDKQFRENDIVILKNLSEGLEQVYASKNQLRQVFLNMFNNAGDAMPNGGTLSVTTYAEKGEVIITIADTGIGVKEENINKIFDAFFTTKSSVKGVGLGLSVCYGFIIEHGGDIKVTSKEGEGTVFIITLPIHNHPSLQEGTEVDSGTFHV